MAADLSILRQSSALRAARLRSHSQEFTQVASGRAPFLKRGGGLPPSARAPVDAPLKRDTAGFPLRGFPGLALKEFFKGDALGICSNVAQPALVHDPPFSPKRFPLRPLVSGIPHNLFVTTFHNSCVNCLFSLAACRDILSLRKEGWPGTTCSGIRCISRWSSKAGSSFYSAGDMLPWVRAARAAVLV